MHNHVGKISQGAVTPSVGQTIPVSNELDFLAPRDGAGNPFWSSFLPERWNDCHDQYIQAVSRGKKKFATWGWVAKFTADIVVCESQMSSLQNGALIKEYISVDKNNGRWEPCWSLLSIQLPLQDAASMATQTHAGDQSCDVRSSIEFMQILLDNDPFLGGGGGVPLSRALSAADSISGSAGAGGLLHSLLVTSS